jgi:hypothetical protein
VAVLSGAVLLAGCGGGSKSSNSTTGATSAQGKVKRLEVTVVGASAAAPGARSFLAWASELLSWGRSAEAATCTVSSQGISATTGPNGKATLVNVPVPPDGNIPVTIDCGGGAVSNLFIPATPNTVVAVTVEVGPGKVQVKARNDHVSEPSEPSEPSEASKVSSKSGHS